MLVDVTVQRTTSGKRVDVVVDVQDSRVLVLSVLVVELLSSGSSFVSGGSSDSTGAGNGGS